MQSKQIYLADTMDAALLAALPAGTHYIRQADAVFYYNDPNIRVTSMMTDYGYAAEAEM